MQLVIETSEWCLPIRLDDHTQEVLLLQIQHAERHDAVAAFSDQLRDRFARALQAAVDCELQLPTERQIAYASTIARELGLSLPAEALRYRGAMYDFLQRHVDPFNDRRRQPGRYRERLALG